MHGDDVVGASREVLTEHVLRHLEDCPGEEAEEIRCPCDGVMLIVCTKCRETMFIALRRGREVCEHAEPLLPF